MFKDYLVIDNFFDNPDAIREFLLKEPYFNRENFKISDIEYHTDPSKIVNGLWRGYRTENIIEKYKVAGKNFNSLVSKIFHTPVEAYGELYGHISTEKMKDVVPNSTKWHEDSYNVLFAGVVYLCKKPIKNSGTWLKINKKVIKIENVYNRLIVYRGDIPHSPGSFFGNTGLDSRLTLTFFINALLFRKKGSVAEPGLLQRS